MGGDSFVHSTPVHICFCSKTIEVDELISRSCWVAPYLMYQWIHGVLGARTFLSERCIFGILFASSLFRFWALCMYTFFSFGVLELLSETVWWMWYYRCTRLAATLPNDVSQTAFIHSFILLHCSAAFDCNQVLWSKFSLINLCAGVFLWLLTFFYSDSSFSIQLSAYSFSCHSICWRQFICLLFIVCYHFFSRLT